MQAGARESPGRPPERLPLPPGPPSAAPGVVAALPPLGPLPKTASGPEAASGPTRGSPPAAFQEGVGRRN